jgi:glycine cleavage system regulatory protein
MFSHRLITFLADDRPGLVEALSDVLTAHGANWLESRMSHLGGKFAGIVRIAVPSARLAEVERALWELESRGMTLRLASAGREAASAPGSLHRLEIVGHDRPGIVHEVAASLARRSINVAELRSDIRSAPMSSGALFHASLEIEVPAGFLLEELRDSLEAIAEELTIEYTLERMPSP